MRFVLIFFFALALCAQTQYFAVTGGGINPSAPTVGSGFIGGGFSFTPNNYSYTVASWCGQNCWTISSGDAYAFATFGRVTLAGLGTLGASSGQSAVTYLLNGGLIVAIAPAPVRCPGLQIGIGAAVQKAANAGGVTPAVNIGVMYTLAAGATKVTLRRR